MSSDLIMKKIIIVLSVVLCCSFAAGQRPSDYLMKARALVSAGRNSEAIQILSDRLASEKDYRFFLERAGAKEATGDYSGAISDLNEANKLVPTSGEYGLSRIYALKGDAQTSLYHLELNLASTFRKGEKEIFLDPAFGSIDNRTEWRSFWKKERFTDVEKKVSEIEYCTSRNRTSDAESILQELRSGYPDAIEVLYSEALIRLESGKAADAVKYALQLTAAAPGNEKYLRLLARAQEAGSNYAGASDTWTRLLESGVPDASLLISRAQCYRKTGEHEKALNDLNRYIELYPDNREALSLAGKTEAVTGDNLKAIELFSKNLKLHPGDPDCYIDRANSYLAAKSWDYAINDYSMSLDIKPGNADAWLNKGVALLGKGQVNDACHDFRRALSLGNKRASEYISRNCIR